MQGTRKPISKNLQEAALEALASVGSARDFRQMFTVVGGDLQKYALVAARAGNAGVVAEALQDIKDGPDLIRAIEGLLQAAQAGVGIRFQQQPSTEVIGVLLEAGRQVGRREGLGATAERSMKTNRTNGAALATHVGL